MKKAIVTMLALFFLAVTIRLNHADSAAPLAAIDCNIWWDEVLHDSFDSDYRSTIGATIPGDNITLRLRTAQSDLTSARVRVWDDLTDTETYINMVWDGVFDTDPVTYDWWVATLPVGAQPTALYYFFELNDDGGSSGCSPVDQDFYVDDEIKFYGGGHGIVSDSYDDSRSYQVTVYDPTFTTPDWLKRGVIYQIFPDRFRDGDPSNNPTAGRFFYNRTQGIITRSQLGGNNPTGEWNSVICDPRGLSAINCFDVEDGFYSDNFYGGDLQGIIDKLEDGYFDNLGVTILYLNPIFFSPSNHKYDTADFLKIDPDFGTLATFESLIATAQAHNIKVILDGVFNHTSSDSPYFDLYSRFDAAGNLVTLSQGIDDNSGGCESPNSSYRPWFYIPDVGTPSTIPTDRCDSDDSDDIGGAWTETYETWAGYGSLPKLQSTLPAVTTFIWDDGTNSVVPYWISLGADGWRFDVGGDIDPGLTHDPSNTYWEGLRDAVPGGNSDTALIGEEWGDATPWLLGNEWDSVMNYRFRSTLLSWLFTGCSGNGCGSDGQGAYFEDNDNNFASSGGEIRPITPSQFNARLRSIHEDYPSMAFNAMMNLEGSHDTNRMRWFLKSINNDNDGAAVQRMKEWWLFSYTYPGSPTLYYGDEVGLTHDSVWANGKWEDDPYNRAPYPWPDASGSDYVADTTLEGHAREMASIRHSYRALQDGDVQHGLIIDDSAELYGYGRTNGTQTALIALNRSISTQTAVFNGLNSAPFNLPDGTIMLEALSGITYTVSSGSLSVPVTTSWGVILLEEGKIDTPQAPANPMMVVDGADITLSWDGVTADTMSEREVATSYVVLTNGAKTANRSATIIPPYFGSPNGRISFTDSGAAGAGNSYTVCAYNAAGIESATCTSLNVPTTVEMSTSTSQSNPSNNNVFIITLLILSLAVGCFRMVAKRVKS